MTVKNGVLHVTLMSLISLSTVYFVWKKYC